MGGGRAYVYCLKGGPAPPPQPNAGREKEKETYVGKGRQGEKNFFLGGGKEGKIYGSRYLRTRFLITVSERLIKFASNYIGTLGKCASAKNYVTLGFPPKLFMSS